MEVRLIEAIVKIAECNSMRKAADQLYVSVTGLKSQVDAVEMELGCRLFDRSAHGCVLTPSGAAFVEGAPDVIAAYEQFVGRVKDAAETHRLRISVMPNKVIPVLDAMCAEYGRRYPEDAVVFVPLAANRLYSDVENGAADLGFFSADDPRTGGDTLDYAHIDLFQHLCAMMLPGNCLAERKSLGPDDLEGFEVVGADSGYPSSILERYAISKAVSLDRYDIMAQCSKGRVCICDEYLAESLTQLRSLPLDGTQTELLVGYRPNPAPSVMRFVECARDVVSRRA